MSHEKLSEKLPHSEKVGVSHRRRATFGKKRLILSRSTSVQLPRLHRFFLECGSTLDCDSFSDSF